MSQTVKAMSLAVAVVLVAGVYLLPAILGPINLPSMDSLSAEPPSPGPGESVAVDQQEDATSSPDPAPGQPPSAWLPGYQGDTPAVQQACQHLAGSVPQLDRTLCLDAGYVATEYSSAGGVPIIARHVTSDVAMGEVMLIGGQHGDELASVSAVMAWAPALADDPGNMNWHVVPALNPDGVAGSPPTRTNGNGVDLDRNMPTEGWAEKVPSYHRTREKKPEFNPGESAGSEPEVQMLVSAIDAVQPDVIVVVGAGLGLVEFSGDSPSTSGFGPLPAGSQPMKPGSLTAYASADLGIPVITISLQDRINGSADEDLAAIRNDLRTFLAERFPTKGGDRQARR